eukprot:scaffold69158_cov39-Prasinocladus_malaysianus.AAC.1
MPERGDQYCSEATASRPKEQSCCRQPAGQSSGIDIPETVAWTNNDPSSANRPTERHKRGGEVDPDDDATEPPENLTGTAPEEENEGQGTEKESHIDAPTAAPAMNAEDDSPLVRATVSEEGIPRARQDSQNEMPTAARAAAAAPSLPPNEGEKTACRATEAQRPVEPPTVSPNSKGR